jgi:hypothetical protein
VHHRDHSHNHDNNPSGGSNRVLLCLYCHDNEHARYLDETVSGSDGVEYVILHIRLQASSIHSGSQADQDLPFTR